LHSKFGDNQPSSSPIEALIGILENTDEAPDRRSDATLGLQNIGEPAVTHLYPLLEEVSVRWAVVWAPGEIDPERTYEYIFPLLKDENKDVSRDTAQVLNKIDSGRAV
jgi:HEAT repeat protein